MRILADWRRYSPHLVFMVHISAFSAIHETCQHCKHLSGTNMRVDWRFSQWSTFSKLFDLTALLRSLEKGNRKSRILNNTIDSFDKDTWEMLVVGNSTKFRCSKHLGPQAKLLNLLLYLSKRMLGVTRLLQAVYAFCLADLAKTDG